MSDIDDIFARSLHHASKSTDIGGAFSPPIVNTSVYRLADDPSGPYQYARWANPTWTALEESLAVLEDAETVTFPSGMAAIAALLYSTLKSGDRVLLPSDGYYTVRVFAEKYLLPMRCDGRPLPDLRSRNTFACRLSSGVDRDAVQSGSRHGRYRCGRAQRESGRCAARGRQHDDDATGTATARPRARMSSYQPTPRR